MVNCTIINLNTYSARFNNLWSVNQCSGIGMKESKTKMAPRDGFNRLPGGGGSKVNVIEADEPIYP